jgi:hypothetical protein
MGQEYMNLSDIGLVWSEMNTGLGDKLVHSLVQDPAHPWIIFALTDSGGLYKNDLNNSEGWVSTGQGLPLRDIAGTPFSSNYPFGTREMMEPFDDGEINRDNNQIESENLLVMCFSPAVPQIVYLGTGGSGVYKSINGGLNWQPAGLPGETIQSLAVDVSDPDLVYAATASPGSLKISVDGGEMWSEAELPVIFYTDTFTQRTGKRVCRY